MSFWITGWSTVSCWRFGAGISVRSVKLSSTHQQKCFFVLFLLGRVEILVSFVQKVVENWIEIKFFGCWSVYIVEILGQRINKKKKNGWNDGWIVSSLIFGCYCNFVWVHSLTLLFHFTVVLIYGGNLGKLQKLLSLIWELFTNIPRNSWNFSRNFFTNFWECFANALSCHSFEFW